jgi:hypothetical protein
MSDPKKVVDIVSRFVNAMSCDEKGFADAVMREHRTLQQNMFQLFLVTIQEWSKQKHYDARNEYTVKTSQQIMELLGDCSGTPFI